LQILKKGEDGLGIISKNAFGIQQICPDKMPQNNRRRLILPRLWMLRKNLKIEVYMTMPVSIRP